MTDAESSRWICESCGFIYDPAEGDPDGGIPPGTPFEDIPDTWFCPVCGARKKDFVPVRGLSPPGRPASRLAARPSRRLGRRRRRRADDCA